MSLVNERDYAAVGGTKNVNASESESGSETANRWPEGVKTDEIV